MTNEIMLALMPLCRRTLSRRQGCRISCFHQRQLYQFSKMAKFTPAMSRLHLDAKTAQRLIS
jgi:hypothetical protein